MTTIPKMYKFEPVCCIPADLEYRIMTKIKKEVASLLLTDIEKKEAIENANNEKIINLTDTIKIKFI